LAGGGAGGCPLRRRPGGGGRLRLCAAPRRTGPSPPLPGSPAYQPAGHDTPSERGGREGVYSRDTGRDNSRGGGGTRRPRRAFRYISAWLVYLVYLSILSICCLFVYFVYLLSILSISHLGARRAAQVARLHLLIGLLRGLGVMGCRGCRARVCDYRQAPSAAPV
jgi:hypothetical protein